MSFFKKIGNKIKAIAAEEVDEKEVIPGMVGGGIVLLWGLGTGIGCLTVLGLIVLVAGAACWLEQRDAS